MPFPIVYSTWMPWFENVTLLMMLWNFQYLMFACLRAGLKSEVQSSNQSLLNIVLQFGFSWRKLIFLDMTIIYKQYLRKKQNCLIYCNWHGSPEMLPEKPSQGRGLMGVSRQLLLKICLTTVSQQRELSRRPNVVGKENRQGIGETRASYF